MMLLRAPRRRVKVQRLALRRTKRLIRFAYKHSVFYRSLYDAHGFHPRQFKAMSDMDKIPMVERTDLRRVLESNPTDLYTRKVRRTYWRQTTSGSSGVPIQIVATRFERMRIKIGILRTYRMAGMRLRDRTVVIKDPIDIRKTALFERFGILRHRYYSIYEPITQIIDALIVDAKPCQILKSMPSDLANLVYTARAQQRRLPQPKQIYSDSETLDAPTRSIIESFFGVKVLDFYANTETGIAAFQTGESSGRYFVPDDLVVIETLPHPRLTSDDRDLVLTGLVNRTTPIIRYRIGDVTAGEICYFSSNDVFQSIQGVHGKYLDFLLRTDGTVVSSHAAKQNLTHLTGIKRFKVSQTRMGHVLITIEKDDDWNDQTLDKIREDFERDFGSESEIEIIFSEDMSKQIAGYRKFKVIESEIAQSVLSRGLMQN